jgi:hypothetical protein
MRKHKILNSHVTCNLWTLACHVYREVYLSCPQTQEDVVWLVWVPKFCVLTVETLAEGGGKLGAGHVGSNAAVIVAMLGGTIQNIVPVYCV